MRLTDYHVHTTFCDGKNTPAEMAEAAANLGMVELGFSAHSYTDFDDRYCIPKERILEYKNTIAELKERYRGKLNIRCGIEQDLFSSEPTDGFDYVIGSVHYVKTHDGYIAVDEDKDVLCSAVKKYFFGDFYSLAEAYFESVARVADMKNLDIIGHFDLITKFNQDFTLFDENHPRYVAAWKAAANRLLQTGKPFEINSGAITRGYTDRPYPSDAILRYLCEHGANVIINSDSHCVDTLGFGFSRWYKKAKDIGFSDDRIVTL
ncbi:MAG: histidinol-phosphatase [Clostridia bacterium]|nr:histidinol-phosphatase [Clostridia bacterium]